MPWRRPARDLGLRDGRRRWHFGRAPPTTLVVNFTTGGILQPVNWTQGNQDPSIFKWGSTLPVKVQFFDCNGLIVSNLVVQVPVLEAFGQHAEFRRRRGHHEHELAR